MQETLADKCAMDALGNLRAGGDESVVGCPYGALLLANPKMPAWRRRRTASGRFCLLVILRAARRHDGAPRNELSHGLTKRSMTVGDGAVSFHSSGLRSKTTSIRDRPGFVESHAPGATALGCRMPARAMSERARLGC